MYGIHLSIQPLVAAVQLGNALFLTSVQMLLKEQCRNATRNSGHNSTSLEDTWQMCMSDFYVTYRNLGQLVPIVPGLFLAWLADRGWRKTPIAVPVVGFVVSRLMLLLLLMLDWPLHVLWVEVIVSGLFGGLSVFWSGTMTLLSLGSSEQDRSKVMMTAELTKGIAGILGCVTSGHLFDVSSSSLRPGVVLMVVGLLLNGVSMVYILLFLQVPAASPTDSVKEFDAENTCERRRQIMTLVLLWSAGILYDATISATKNILVVFQLLGPLHWNVTQLGYGNAFGFLILLSSFLSISLMSRWIQNRTLITIGMVSYAMGTSLMGFVTTTSMFYVANSLTLCSLMPTPIIRSLVTQQVHESLYGKVLTSLQLSLKVSSTGFNLLLKHIYQQTFTWCPGFVFIVSSVVTLVAIIPIQLQDSGLMDSCSYERVPDDEEDELFPVKTSCGDDTNGCDEV